LKGLRLLDLGCGTGDLAIDAARMEATVVGVDIAPEMIDVAESQSQNASEEVSERISFQVGDVEAYAAENPDKKFDVITAMGLIEYLENDHELLRSVKSLLPENGQFFVQCRNQLFNLSSANDYLQNEVDAGNIESLLSELGSLDEYITGDTDTAGVTTQLCEALGNLSSQIESGALSGHDSSAELPDRSQIILRRQHTPSSLAESCKSNGLRLEYVVFYRLHPLPPSARALFPRFYNRLSMAMQALGETAEVAPIASSFVACITHDN